MEPLRDNTKEELIEKSGDDWYEDLGEDEYIIGECSFEKYINPIITKLRKENNWASLEEAKSNFRRLINYKSFINYMEKKEYSLNGIYPETIENTSTGEEVRIVFNVDEISEDQGRAILDFIDAVNESDTGCIDEEKAIEKMKISIISTIRKSDIYKSANIKWGKDTESTLRDIADELLSENLVQFFGVVAEIEDNIIVEFLQKYFKIQLNFF